MDSNQGSRYTGLVVMGGLITGVLGLFWGLLAILNEYDYVGGGLCFLASAFVFGLMANALLRD